MVLSEALRAPMVRALCSAEIKRITEACLPGPSAAPSADRPDLTCVDMDSSEET